MSYKRIEIADEKTWLEERHKYLTASDLSAALSHNPWKTAEDLWLEKTKLQEPADISNKPQIIRGKEREPFIREQFAKEHEGFIKVDYHPYDIFVSQEPGFEMLGATLDGELEVTNEYNPALPVGSKGILECKSVGYRCLEDLDKWPKTTPPIYYYDQLMGQLFCKDDCSFAFLQAEFHYEGEKDKQGDLPDYYSKRYLVIKNKDVPNHMMTVACYCRDWWNSRVLTKTPPEHVIENIPEAPNAETHEIAVIKADCLAGKFLENFDEIKSSVAAAVEPYKGIVFTDSQARDAKALHAQMKKKITELNDVRKTVKKKYLEPLTVFEDKVKEIVAVIDEARIPIEAQLDTFEANRIAKKTDQIMSKRAEIINELISEADMDYFVSSNMEEFLWKDSWLNKSMSMKKVEEDIRVSIMGWLKDLSAIKSYGEGDPELMTFCLDKYAESKDLAIVISAKQKFEQSRAHARRIAEEQAAREELERQRGYQMRQEKLKEYGVVNIDTHIPSEPTPQPQPQTAINEHDNPSTARQERQLITFTFRASHTSKKEWADLITYMRQHGFNPQRLS